MRGWLGDQWVAGDHGVVGNHWMVGDHGWLGIMEWLVIMDSWRSGNHWEWEWLNELSHFTYY